MTDEVKKNETEQTEMTEGLSGAVASGEGKTYSQDELDRLFAERARRAESALLKKLGFEKLEDAEALIEEHNQRKQAEMSELEKAQAKVAELQQKLEAAGETQKALALQGDIVAKSAKLGIVDADAALKLLDKGAIEYDANGKPTNTVSLLNELLKAKPYLAGAGTKTMNAGKTKTDGELTWADAIKESMNL